MTDELPPDLDLYSFLTIPPTATDSELRSAFRKQSLLFHPDKNKSPDAPHKFHLLTLAFNVLNTPSSREAYDNSRKAKVAKAERLAKYDDERRRMQKDLEEREREAKRRRVEKFAFARKGDINPEEQMQRLKEESERLKRMRQERMREELEKAEEQLKAENEVDESERTIKVRFQKGVDRTKITHDLVVRIFSQFGEVENVILGKSALVIFNSASEAKAAIDNATKGPAPAANMIKQVTLVQPPSASHAGENDNDLDTNLHRSPPPTSQVPQTEPTSGTTARKFSFKPPPIVNTNSADYESITLMRMRKIAQAKLEKEIREQEENDEATQQILT